MDELSINTFLKNISSELFISYNSSEKEKIETSLNYLIENIYSYFDDTVIDINVFGSYTRGTTLPRKYDENSDIDILIIFNTDNYDVKPETYRNQLRKFALEYYSKSEIIKSFPSVILELNHIKFDLVAAIEKDHWIFNKKVIHIPRKGNNWIKTYPNEFNKKLTNSNVEYDSIVKPIIRLLKYWNASHKYPYESFVLEQLIADMNFAGGNYETGFFYAIEELRIFGLELSEESKKTINTLKDQAKMLRVCLKKGIEKRCNFLLNKILPNLI